MSKQEQDETLIEIIKPKIAVFEDTPLRDPRLTWRAKGIIAYLLSKPPGWQIWTSDLVHRSADGRSAVLAGLKELETFGYLKRERYNDARGRIQWRKVLSATPETMWNDSTSTSEMTSPLLIPSPEPEKPVMATTQPPCTDNSNEKREVRATATPSEELVTSAHITEAPAATPEEKTPEPEPDGLAIVRRICDDCFIKIAPETLYGYASVDHIVAEAARWWYETPAHMRHKNAGMLVYRIKTRQFQPLTQTEIVACTPYDRWLRGDTEEPQQEEPQQKEPVSEPAASVRKPVQPARQAPALDVDDPRAVWRQVLTEFALEMPPNQLGAWIQASHVLQYEDGHFIVGLPNACYLDWAEDRLRPRIKRKLASIMRRNSIDISFRVDQAADTSNGLVCGVHA